MFRGRGADAKQQWRLGGQGIYFRIFFVKIRSQIKRAIKLLQNETKYSKF